MISYIQVLDVFKTFAQGHLQIQKFDFEFREQMPNLATVNEAYPMLFVVPVGGSTLENVREFDIDIYCVDRYQKDRSNVNYVISDTDLILGDLTRWLEEGQDDIEVVRTYTTTPINNDLLDYVGGHVMRMRVQVDRIALCEIPFDGETPVPPTCPSAIVRNSDGTWSDIVPSGGLLIVPNTPVTVTDTNGNTLDTVDVVSVTGGAVVAPDASYLVEYENGTPIQSGTIPSGGSETIQVPNPIVCEDATVENSDGSYTDTVASGDTLILPDETINIVDENGNPIDSITFPVYTDPNIDITSYCPAVTPQAGRELLKTGQTTSYRTGDDGDLQEGRDVDFFTLDYTNPFGNTNRFTDELGGQTYTNNIVIDWTTYNAVTGKVLGWDRRNNGGGASANKSWNASIDEALAHSVGTFTSGWRLPNKKEVESIVNDGLTQALNYAPFNINNSFTYWTSTTPNGTTTSAYLYYTQILSNSNYIILQPKTATSGYRWLAVRTFTVTGTTLS